MYCIHAVTNVSTWYWNDNTKTMFKHQDNATKYDDWKIADKRCEELNAEKLGAFFHCKMVTV